MQTDGSQDALSTSAAVRLMLDRPMKKGYGKATRDRDETEGATGNMQWR